MAEGEKRLQLFEVVPTVANRGALFVADVDDVGLRGTRTFVFRGAIAGDAATRELLSGAGKCRGQMT